MFLVHHQIDWYLSACGRRVEKVIEKIGYTELNRLPSIIRRNLLDLTMANLESGRTQAEIDQDELARRKYGGKLKKKTTLLSKERAFFDSADWALNKQKGEHGEVPSIPAPAEGELPPKLEPTQRKPVPVRGRSSLAQR